MVSFPVDVARMGSMIVTGVSPDVDDAGTQRDRDGVRLWKVEVLVRPEPGPSGRAPRASVEVVKIAAADAPDLEPMEPVVFGGLVARPWQMGSRSGVSMSADSVACAVTA